MENFPFRSTVVALRGLVLLAAASLLAVAGAAEPKAATPGKGAKDFMPFVELAPFVVNGKQLAISIYARSKSDRRYAEDFSEEVVKVVYESVTVETGKGLVIIGKKGEPHPVFVFRKFLALAKEGKLDPDVAARGPELYTMLDHWKDTVGDGKAGGSDGEEEVDVEFEKIMTALPLPLEGIGAKLYQLAWSEDFNDARVEAKLRALHTADLEGNMFARFDWVFYLPPRGAFESAIDDIIADALKEEKAGMFERAIVKGAMMMVKPSIRRMVEGMRRSVMFSAVVQTRAPYGPEEVADLTNVYMDALMNEHKDTSVSEHERAVKAVRAKVLSFEEKPKPAEKPKAEEEPKRTAESKPAEEPVPEPAAEGK